MKSYRLFLWLNTETKTNVLSFALHCTSIVRKTLHQSLKEFHDTTIKQQQINFHHTNPHQLCLLHSNRKQINCRVIFSEPNIFCRESFICNHVARIPMNIITSTIRIKAIYLDKKKKEKLIKNDSENAQYQSLAIVEILKLTQCKQRYNFNAALKISPFIAEYNLRINPLYTNTKSLIRRNNSYQTKPSSYCKQAQLINTLHTQTTHNLSCLLHQSQNSIRKSLGFSLRLTVKIRWIDKNNIQERRHHVI
jgi:hypothetical protein